MPATPDAPIAARHRADDVVVGDHRGQVDEPDTVDEAAAHRGGDLHRQSGLADAAGAGQGDQPTFGDRGRQLLHVLVPPDQGGGHQRQVGGDGRAGPQRREPFRQARGSQLEHPLRPGQVAEPLLPQVDQRHIGGQVVPHQLLGGVGDQHLAPVGRTPTPGRPGSPRSRSSRPPGGRPPRCGPPSAPATGPAAPRALRPAPAGRRPRRRWRPGPWQRPRAARHRSS